MLNSFTFGQPNWALWLMAAGLLLTLLVVYNYRKARLPWTVKLFAASLKLTAILVILASLLDPMLAVQRPQSQANRVAVVLDHSRSMSALIADRTLGNQSDGLSAEWKEKLSSQADWQAELETDFRVRRYRFGSQLEAVDDLEPTMLTETSSAMYRSLELLAERMRGVPTAAVVLLSDGQVASEDRPSETETSWDGKSLGFAVYPVDLGSALPESDLRITDVVLRQSDFEAAPVTIMSKLEATSLAGRTADVKLIDAQSNIVEQRSIKLDGSTAIHPLEFRFRPKDSGVQIYRIVASLSPTPVLTGVGSWMKGLPIRAHLLRPSLPKNVSCRTTNGPLWLIVGADRTKSCTLPADRIGSTNFCSEPFRKMPSYG